MPTPNINIQNGQITGTLQRGQIFFWYNPTGDNVTIKNCGTWCDADSYTIGPTSYAQGSILLNPNISPCAWTEFPNEWTAGGMPHITNPPEEADEGEEEIEKEVA